MMERKKLAVFDLDGTLFDTAEVNYRSYAAAAEKLGIMIDRGRFLQLFIGRNYREFLPAFGIVKKEDLEFIHEEKKKQYIKYVKYAKKNETLFELIDTMKKEYIITLATTASRACTEELLKYFHVSGVFDYLLTQDDLQELKPNPECYYKAMKLAKISHENTIIFEDSEAGIAAGLASGANVYKVYGF